MRTIPYALLITCLASPLQAETIRWTNSEGENAVPIGDRLYSWNDLQERRNLNPERFDFHHERIGHLLENTEMLCARLTENPSRFAHYHPFIAYLLEDYCQTPTPLPPPPPMPPIPMPPCPSPKPCPNGPPKPPNVVPSPSSWSLTLGMIIGLILVRRSLYDHSR